MLLASLFAATLAACNAARSPQAAPPAPGTPPAPARTSDVPPPEGPGCAGAVSRYRGVVDNDLAMGHVNKGVHAQISNEISEAAAACSGGQDGRALSLLRASKSRHGYPG